MLSGSRFVSVPLRRTDNLLDFSDHDDACQHLLHLLTAEGLGGVPYGTVGRHHRLRGQVVGVVATFGTLRAGTDDGRTLVFKGTTGGV